MASLDRDRDNDAVQQEDDDEDNSDDGVSNAIRKVMHCALTPPSIISLI